MTSTLGLILAYFLAQLTATGSALPVQTPYFKKAVPTEYGDVELTDSRGRKLTATWGDGTVLAADNADIPDKTTVAVGENLTISGNGNKLAEMQPPASRGKEREYAALPRIKVPQDLPADSDLHQFLLTQYAWNETAALRHNRYMPKTYAQYLTSVLTLWNLLDRNIERHLGAAGTPFGYMRPVQLHTYSQLVFDADDATYCEVGFNGGHGAVAMLLANPTLKVHAFELEANGPYSATAAEIVTTYFGRRRFEYHRGDSHITVPAFANQHGRVCDIVLVDGDHSAQGAFADIKNMRDVARRGAVLLIDDIIDGPGRALRRAADEKIISHVEWHRYDKQSRANPCVRRVRGARFNCLQAWGWARSRYVIAEERQQLLTQDGSHKRRTRSERSRG